MAQVVCGSDNRSPQNYVQYGGRSEENDEMIHGLKKQKKEYRDLLAEIEKTPKHERTFNQLRDAITYRRRIYWLGDQIRLAQSQKKPKKK